MYVIYYTYPTCIFYLGTLRNVTRYFEMCQLVDGRLMKARMSGE